MFNFSKNVKAAVLVNSFFKMVQVASKLRFMFSWLVLPEAVPKQGNNGSYV